MAQTKGAWLAIGLVIGLAVGVSLSGVLPQTSVHAVATDSQEGFAIATGTVQDDLEAVYFLDFLTGDLRAAVLSAINGKFLSFFTYNVAADLSEPGAKNPRYLMVTGKVDLRRGLSGNFQPAQSVVYVAEATSGLIAAYGMPWAGQLQSAGRPQLGQLILLDKKKFRTAAVRD